MAGDTEQEGCQQGPRTPHHGHGGRMGQSEGRRGPISISLM